MNDRPVRRNPANSKPPKAPALPVLAATAPASQTSFGQAPVGQPPGDVRLWFDGAARAAIPAADGTLATAREAADAYARHAKADNTRRAYRAGVRAWCAWCETHALPCLPASAADIAAFLAAERGRGATVSTLTLRRAAIRYLHFIAGLPVPTAEARVAETMAGIQRRAIAEGESPNRKLAATIAILGQILAPLGDDLVSLRDRALLLTGFAGALRRSELAAIRVEHLETRDRGLHLTLPHSKGERTGKAVVVAIPYGSTALCPVRALQRWQKAAGITEGPVFRRIWQPPTRAKAADAMRPDVVIGIQALDPGTVARIIKLRAQAAGFDPAVVSGHSLKRGALTTGKDLGIHPSRLKQLGRHKTYAVLDSYLEFGDPFDGHPLGNLL
jgi:integrase